MGEMRIKPVSTQVPAATPQGRPTGVAKSGPAFRHVDPNAKRLIAQNPGGIVGGAFAVRLTGGNGSDRIGLELCSKARALTLGALEQERVGFVAAIEKLAVG